MKSPRRKILLETILISFLAFALAMIFTYPAIFHLNSLFIGDGGDNYEYASYMGLANKNIGWGRLPFSPTDFWRFPVGFEFSRGFDSYLAVSLGTLLTTILGLTAAYNLTVLLLMSLNGITSYFFFKILTKERILGIAGMLLYGFSFYTLAKAASHLNLLCISGIPLLALSIIRIIQKETLTWKDFAFFFFSLIFISLGSTQYLIMFALLLVLYLILFFFVDKKQVISLYTKIKNRKLAFITMGLVAFVIFIVLYFPHLKAMIEGKFILLKRENTLYTLTPGIWDYLLPNSYLRLLLSKITTSPNIPSIDKVVFLGWIELVFFIGFIFSSVKKNIKLLILTLFFLPFVLSLGYGHDNDFFLLPYHFISKLFPFSALIETGRYFVAFYFFIVCGILLLLASIKSYKIKTIFIVILLSGAFLERLPNTYYLSDTFSTKPYIDPVKKLDSYAVLDLPINYYYAPYNMLSLYYNKPIVNGYFHWSADGPDRKQFITDNYLLSRYTCAEGDRLFTVDQEKNLDREMIHRLLENRITTIVIHKDDKYYHPVCQNVRVRINQLFSSVTEAKETPPDKEKEIVITTGEGRPKFQLYFPISGQFFLGGTYIAPSSEAIFDIVQNDIPVPFEYFWNYSSNYSMNLLPEHTISINTQASDMITFFSNDIVNSTYFSLWYRFIPEINSTNKPYASQFKKIFEDDKASVYYLVN